MILWTAEHRCSSIELQHIKRGLMCILTEEATNVQSQQNRHCLHMQYIGSEKISDWKLEMCMLRTNTLSPLFMWQSSVVTFVVRLAMKQFKDIGFWIEINTQIYLFLSHIHSGFLAASTPAQSDQCLQYSWISLDSYAAQ